MITFSKLEILGRLGNQMFQIASTIGLARKHNHSFFFPEWKYRHYFKNPVPFGEQTPDFIALQEKKYRHHGWDIGDKNYDLEGWLQSELYFDRKATKEIFAFKPDFEENVLKENAHLFNRKTILVSIRRGDFVNHPLYFQLTYKYFFLGLIRNFPDWKERNIVFTSDEISYCQYHFGHLKNAFFLVDVPPVETIVIGTHCDDYVISNSTFAWWMAWLGEEKETKVIRPIKNFNEESTDKDDSDYYPDRWISFDDSNQKIPLRHFRVIIKGELFLLKELIVRQLRRIKRRFFK